MFKRTALEQRKNNEYGSDAMGRGQTWEYPKLFFNIILYIIYIYIIFQWEYPKLFNEEESEKHPKEGHTAMNHSQYCWRIKYLTAYSTAADKE